MTEMHHSKTPLFWAWGACVSGLAGASREEPVIVMGMAKGGTIRAIAENIFDFGRIREAHARVDTTRKVGAVVMSPGGEAFAKGYFDETELHRK